MSTFSIIGVVERYEKGQFKRSTRSHERFSQAERRAILQVTSGSSATNGDSDWSSRLRVEPDSYYYDANSNIWLKKSGSQCSESSQESLEASLFGDGLVSPVKLLSDRLNYTLNESHFVGLAKLLVYIEKLKAHFTTDPELRMVRGMKAIVFKNELIPQSNLSETTKAQRVMLEVHYNYLLKDQINLPETLPIRLELIYSRSMSPNMLVVNLYQIRKAEGVDPNRESRSSESFLFPLALDCARFLKSKQEAQREPLKEIAQFSKVTFKARLFNRAGIHGNGKLDWEANFFFAFDIRANLLRRDRYIMDNQTVRRVATSTTIYDFNLNKKYHSYWTKTSSDSYQNFESPFLFEAKAGHCALATITDSDRHGFIHFERLQFMGLTDIDGVRAKVFEDGERSTSVPFWMFPDFIAHPSGRASDADEQTSSSSKTSLTYYFATQSDDRGRVGKLLRIDFTVRDSMHGTVMLSKTLLAHDFSWHQHSHLPVGGTGLDLFSLAKLCTNDSRQRRSAQLALLLEPSPINIKNDKYDPQQQRNIIELLHNQAKRNGILSDALGSELSLVRTHIDSLQSKLLVRHDRMPQLPATINRGWSLPSVEMEIDVSEFDLDLYEFTLLGWGDFLRHSSVKRFGPVEFEDCLWSAYHESLEIESEVLFTHDGNYCNLDSLYIWEKMRTNKSEMEAAVETSNFIPIRSGTNLMYRTQKISGKEAATRDSLWLKFSRGDLHLIGHQIKLPAPSQDQSLQYLLRLVKMSGELAKLSHTTATVKRINYLGWHEIVEHNKTVDMKPRYSAGVARPTILETARFTEASCQFECLTDMECKSYSFCQSFGSEFSECRLSTIDINEPTVIEQLLAVQPTSMQVNALRGNSWKQLVLDKSGVQSTSYLVKLRINKGCYISAKSYASLFDNSYQVKVDTSSRLKAIQVQDEDQCARFCFETNLNYFRRLVEQKLDLNLAHKEMLRMKVDGDVSLERLELALDWHKQHLTDLCTHFYYTETNAGQQSNNGNSSCYLANHSSTPVACPIDDVTSKQQPSLVTTNLYKLIYSRLYRRTKGRRLIGIEQRLDSGDNEPIVSIYKRLLVSHQSGHNEQVKIPMDDAEYCARACTLQLHGPRPSCSSFDFVFERTNTSAGSKYCLLNSVSLSDLRRHNQADNQTLYADESLDVQYWHYEPRELLIVDTEENEKINQDAFNVLNELELKLIRVNAFTSISIVIMVIGLMSGLTLGITLGQLKVARKTGARDIKLENRLCRLVHRLSGVSLSSNMQEGEVRM